MSPKRSRRYFTRAAIIGCFLTISLLALSSGQTAHAQVPENPFANEINPSEVQDFIQENSANPDEYQPEASFRQVRMIYLVPSDKSVRDDYRGAMGNAILNLQRFYQQQMGNGYAFSTHFPLVEVVYLNRSSGFYGSSNPDPYWFWKTVTADGFAATGGRFNDPNNRWVYYIDADEACGQNVGGTSAVALLPANDLRGLTDQPRIPRCGGGSDGFPYPRWVGGLGHELGHAFGLNHPPGCDAGACYGGEYARRSLMYQGVYYYPDTYLLSDDTSILYGTGFFTPFNLLDSIDFFVRQQYLDFLSREPEYGGFIAWTNVLRNCSDVNNNPSCDRVTVSGSFFRSTEFQIKGYFFYRFYTTAFSRRPVYLNEFVRDNQLFSAHTSEEVEPKKQAFIADFMSRDGFRSTYDGLSNQDYVDTLLARAGVSLSYRDQMISDLNNGTQTRGQVLRRIVESTEVYNKEYNGAFVGMEYFGYLKRDPEESGYNAWLNYLNAHPDDFRSMVRGFLDSVENRMRFGPP